MPIAARVLLIAAFVAGVLTVAAAAREPAGPAAGDTSVAPGTTPPGAVALGPGSAPPSAAATPAEWAEGAIPIPDDPPQPPAEESRYQSGSRFAMPLASWTAVTDRFGAPRGPGLMHGGIDLALDDRPRSNVYSACTGTVSAAGYSDTYGYNVTVDCGDGWSTLYAHMSELAVSSGTAVTPESVVGLSGSTGFSTGEHLHFEVIWRGARVNPEDYLDFKIPPGTPLSSGPLVFGLGGGSTAAGGGNAGRGPASPPAPGETPAGADPGAEPTATSTATATRPAPTATATNTPTATPTSTPTPTPMPPTPTRTPTPRPVLR